MKRLWIQGIVVLASVSGCFLKHNDIALAPSIPAASGEMRTMFSLRYIDVATGPGKPAEAGHCFYAHYTGWLVDGKKFDSSHDTTPQGQARKPLSFIQGARQVIAGWDAGFEGMRVGGKRRLFIPYQLAYGERGRPPLIPPRAMLVFDVELMDVRDAPPATRPPAPPARCPDFEAP